MALTRGAGSSYLQEYEDSKAVVKIPTVTFGLEMLQDAVSTTEVMSIKRTASNDKC
jgi:hypothetical protein